MIAPFLLAAALSARAQVPTDPLDAATPIPRLAVGSVVFVGEDHPLFDLADFPVTAEGDGVSARWIEGSVKWIRGEDGVPLPRARLLVRVAGGGLLRYRGRTVLLQADPDGGGSVELFVPLLEGGIVLVERDGKSAGRVTVATRAATATPLESRHAIDHSCSPWRVSVTGLDDSFLSMNCRMTPVGRLGREQPLLEARWAGIGGAAMSADLRDGRPAKATIPGPDGAPREVSISATLPERVHRLRLAWGAGPYSLKTSEHAGNGAAGGAMLYANLRLRNEGGLSLRAFDAAVSQSPAQTPFFNNLGLYFAYDAAQVWDSRLRLTALLGVQSVTYAPQGLAHAGVYDQALFPQGFEVSYFDAFGRRNRTLSGGLFLQPVTNKPYQNFWIRYGSSWFGELNYLSWRSYDRRAKMFGVSVGAPLAQLF